MKIGIFLGYGPNAKLLTEGLGRYLAGLLKGFIESGNEIVIACPAWLEKNLALLCEDNKINIKNIEMITVKDPAIIELKNLFFQKRKTVYIPKNRFVKLISGFIFEILSLVMSLTSTIVLITSLLLLVLIGLILLPVSVIAFVIYFLSSSLLYILKNHKNKLRTLLNKSNFVNKFIMFYKMAFGYIENPIRRLYDKMISNVLLRLVKKINMIECTDLWFSPALNWPAFNNIGGTKVIAAPDLVTSNYPFIFAGTSLLEQTESIKNTIRKGNYFITYSDFIKYNVLVRDFNKKAINIFTIPHAANKLDSYIDIYSNTRHLNYPPNVNEVFARQQLSSLRYFSSVPNIGGVRDYISNFSFMDVKYIFYSSQIRPHKNILNLVKAYEFVLRKKFKQVKLILTGDYTTNKDVMDYILEKRLEYDVLSFSKVSSQMLACLYSCAELVVNPTLYEGGFPFTFSEGMSVGTPSVMSKIPQTIELLEKYEIDEFVFDPYSWEDIADKIIYGLDNKNKLYVKQLEIYEELKKRSWSTVANEYVNAFEYFITNQK